MQNEARVFAEIPKYDDDSSQAGRTEVMYVIQSNETSKEKRHK
jgi:hypothetical protein